MYGMVAKKQSNLINTNYGLCALVLQGGDDLQYRKKSNVGPSVLECVFTVLKSVSVVILCFILNSIAICEILL